jgi:anaerobic magnesium-protoporphyrin IX monomethyl ester cyclase
MEVVPLAANGHGPARQKSVLVLSGKGPYFKNSVYYDETMFDLRGTRPLAPEFPGHPLSGLRLTDLTNRDGSPLLRPERGDVPHLTSYTLESILLQASRPFELFDLQDVWNKTREPTGRHPVVFLSTSFICDKRTLGCALAWIQQRCEDALVVVGGQFSNLKYDWIMRNHPEVDIVVRGDGEHAIPLLLNALDRGNGLQEVPNLVVRTGTEAYRMTSFRYIDIDEHPSPAFGTQHLPVVPYESMRGCPFSCKFCSFPFASPTWRYKSAEKIASDWARYRDVNETRHVYAMDSTFTVPPTRLRRLMELLPSVGVTWEGYTRANSISGRDMVERLAETHCVELSLGFESMSANTLELMNKKVRVEHNRRAHDALVGGPIRYRASFMAGYPGETPDDYALTHNYLLNEYTGRFYLSVFSMTDETMPVWQDADRLQLKIQDFEDPDAGWTHIGMDSVTAERLRKQTLDEVRRANDDAVLLLWQMDYQLPLLPRLPHETNLRAEKLVERLGMLPVDIPDPGRRLAAAAELLSSLDVLGVRAVSAPVSSEALVQ